MNDLATADAPQDGNIVLTDAMHEWVLNTYGVDPRHYEPAPQVETPETRKADLKRRLDASQDLYVQQGQINADEITAPQNRLSSAEAKIGQAFHETDTTVDGAERRTGYDEKGITRTGKQTAGFSAIGKDGRVEEFTRERGQSTTYGLGNKTSTDSSKMVHSAEGTTKTTTEQTTKTTDLLKGERSTTESSVVETKTAAGTVKDTDRTTVTKGVSGYMTTVEKATQTDSKLQSTTTTSGVSRGAGQLGYSKAVTTKKGEMAGIVGAPPDVQTMVKGTETTTKIGGGAISDDKGTGLAFTPTASVKAVGNENVSLNSTVGGGGKVQAIVKEVAGSNPPKFTITTTISFDFTAGSTTTLESSTADKREKLDENSTVGKEVNRKTTASGGISGGVSATASFKRELEYDEAKNYLKCIEENGRGAKLPEHDILATAMTQGWESAYKLYGSMGSSKAAKKLKPGEEMEASHTLSAGAKGSLGRGESRLGGAAFGADGSASVSHKVTIKKTGMPDGNISVTVSVDNSFDTAKNLSGGYGVMKASHGTSHGDSEGRTLVFLLDPTSTEFDQQLARLDKLGSMDELDDISHDKSFNLQSRTDKEGGSHGVTDGAGVTALGVSAGISLMGKGTHSNEETTDADGNIISTKSTGTGQVGGTLNLGDDLKLSDSVTEGYTGEVVGGEMKGDISRTHRHTSAKKTATNTSHAHQDPIGTVLNPSKLLGEAADVEGTAINDPETLALAELAFNIPKWNGQMGGRRQDDWIKTGEKLRAAFVLENKVPVGVDKSAVQKALAEWVDSDDGERTELLDRLLRPFGGKGHLAGKGYSFPEGTDYMQPDWNQLGVGDPLVPVHAKAKKDPAGALKDTETVAKRIETLIQELKTKADKFKGFEAKHAEMLGHLNTRHNEAIALERDLHKALAHQAKPAAGGGAAASAPVSDAEEDRRADVKTYLANLEQMREYKKTVFEKAWEVEQELKATGFFSDRGSDKVMKSSPMIKQCEDEIQLWQELYDESYKLWEKISPATKVDKAKLEELHVHGAQQRVAELHAIIQSGKF